MPTDAILLFCMAWKNALCGPPTNWKDAVISYNQAYTSQFNTGQQIYCEPSPRVRWSDLSLEQFWLPESALSLYGTPEFDSLNAAQRRRLSHFEFIYNLDAALYLESVLIARIARALHTRLLPAELHALLLREIQEESGHSIMFIEFLRRAGLTRVTFRNGRTPWFAVFARELPFNSTFFWVAMLITEEITDAFNQVIVRHESDLCNTVVDMARLHMTEEAGHIAFAEQRLNILLTACPTWKRWGLALFTRNYLNNFINTYFFPSPQCYRLAGLDPAVNWRRLALANTERRRFINEQLAPKLHCLSRHAITSALRYS